MRCSLSFSLMLSTCIALPAMATGADGDNPREARRHPAAQPHPTPSPLMVTFVDAKSLPANFNRVDPLVTVLDTRAAAVFAAGHLPRASNLPWEKTRAEILERKAIIGGKLPADIEALVEVFVAHGVRLDRSVLVCGDPKSGWGEEGRVAWTLLYLGHPDVRILNGGCAASARATSTVKMPLRGKAWTPKVQGKWRVTRDVVLEAVRSKDRNRPQLLDVRTVEEYRGATPYFEARGGHIEGALHLDYRVFLDANGHLRSPQFIRDRLSAVGVDVERPVIAYCTGGVRSAWTALALATAGVNAANYDGSMWEWAADPTLPMTTAPAKAPNANR